MLVIQVAFLFMFFLKKKKKKAGGGGGEALPTCKADLVAQW